MGMLFSTSQPVTNPNSAKNGQPEQQKAVDDAQKAVAEAKSNYELAKTKHNSMPQNTNNPNNPNLKAAADAMNEAEKALLAAEVKLASIQPQSKNEPRTGVINEVRSPLTPNKGGGRSRKIRLKLKMKKKKRAKTLVRR